MSHTLDFLSLLRLKRPDFLTTITPEELAVMELHRDYVMDLFEQGKIVMGGTAVDGTLDVLIYRVDSAVEARRLFYNDPAVIAGIGYPELHPFQIGHLADI
jgi:uncharacterized protein